MKVIFLDIDGVLNHHTWCLGKEFKKRYCEKTGYDETAWFDPSSVDLLNQILKETKAEIVVSSTWRYSRNQELLQILFDQVNIKGTVLDKTPDLGLNKTRGEEIQKWLDNTTLNIESYVIIDDDFDMLVSQKPNFINVSADCGISEQNVQEVIKILNK